MVARALLGCHKEILGEDFPPCLSDLQVCRCGLVLLQSKPVGFS